MIRFTMLFLAVALYANVSSAFPVNVRGGDEKSFAPKTPSGAPAVDKGPYDVIVVGGGLAGMTATMYLTDLGKRVLLLEKEEALGGLAFGGIGADGVPFNRGGAYWTPPFEEEEKIMDRIGLSTFTCGSMNPSRDSRQVSLFLKMNFSGPTRTN
ncbi:MAG: NAD(P)-binding protein [Bdellovibrionia bacterium]